MIADREAPAVDERGHDEAGHRGDRADRQVDAAGQHRQGLAAGEDRERHRRPQDDRRPTSAPTMPGSASSITDDQDEEQADQRDDRPVAEQAAPRLRALPPATRRPRRSRPHPPDLDEAADITTPMRITPWTTIARLGLMLRNVMSVRMSCRMRTATIGPKTPPRPPARLTPPSTMAATLSQRVRPGHRRADRVLAVRLSPASAANRPVIT